MDFGFFAASELAVYAFLDALLIVSEAARKLGAEAEALVPGQPWRGICSVGNVLRHEYDGVDPDTVWRIIASGDLAALKEAVSTAVAGLRAKGNSPPVVGDEIEQGETSA